MVGLFWKLYIGQPVGGELDLLVLIGGATLKMASAIFAETLDNSQHSTRLIPDSQSCTMDSSCENLRTRTLIQLQRLYCVEMGK
jgi:hypothetical protein